MDERRPLRATQFEYKKLNSKIKVKKFTKKKTLMF